MESTLWWTLAVLAGVGVIAVILGVSILIALWWVILPIVGAVWAGWFGFFCGIAIVVLLTAVRRFSKKK